VEIEAIGKERLLHHRAAEREKKDMSHPALPEGDLRKRDAWLSEGNKGARVQDGLEGGRSTRTSLSETMQ